MDPVQIGLLLGTPTVTAVVGALLWWRMGRVETEVQRMRDDRHRLGNDVAVMQGAVEALKEVVVEAINAASSRRGKRGVL